MANLRLPGPTPVPPDVVEAMSKEMIDHRGAEFAEMLRRITANLQRAFLTQNDVFVFTSSGTGAMEAAIVNTLSPGERVLAISVGNFGDRFARIANAYGADVNVLKCPDGEAVDPERVRQALKDDPAVSAVLVTHNETSTGITNELEAIAGIVKGEFDKLLLVDAVSSLGCIPLPVDAWNCDMVGTASQKGFMIPPGLSFISVSEQAWEAQQTASMPRFYFDLTMAKSYLAIGQTPFTPNLSAMYGLSLALDKLLEEGMENVFGRHAAIARRSWSASSGVKPAATMASFIACS